MEYTEKDKIENFIEDLIELRKTIIYILIPSIVIFILMFYFSKRIILKIIEINKVPISSVVSLTPMESIQLQISTSMILTSVLMIPIAVFFIFKFCSPAIERKNVWTIILYLYSSIVLSFLGFILGITIFSSYIINSLSYYQIVSQMWSIKSVMGFILSLGFSIGLVLQTVIIIPLIVSLDIITRKELISYSLIIFMFISMLAGIITPPDIISQIVVICPFFVSFWVGIIITKIQEVIK